MEKTVHFVSLGCPKNWVDTEIMLGTLQKDGYQVVTNAQEAETVIVNTCGFIDESKRESIAKILEMGELKKKGSISRLVVAGCLTQRYKDDLVDGLPEADLFIGTGEFQNIAKILRSTQEGEKKRTFFNLPTYLQEDHTPRVHSQWPYRSYLKISEGCKKRCAFCAIPSIRGNLQSRNIKSILSEAQLLVASGVKELILISHDFTDYGWDLKKSPTSSVPSNPVELLRTLADHSGAEWIRVLYLYPDGISHELIQLIKEKNNLVPYFDMPLQHINSDVLKRMNRRMTRDKIVESLNNIRTALPEAVIRTQFIVGFPGETEEEFQELLTFVQEQKFDRVGCFTYSQEEGTKAGQMPDQIEDKVKEHRKNELMLLQQKISRKKHKSLIGKTLKILVEGLSEETDLLLQGRHAQQSPDIDGVTYINKGTAQPGDIVDVLITEAHDYDLVGMIVPS